MTIRHLTAVVLLAIFALSNTPIRVLHHFFADHTDQKSIVYTSNGKEQLNVAGIDCHVDSNVVINPYICNKILYSIPAAGSFVIRSDFYTVTYHDTRIQHIESRGPPADV